MSCEWREGIDPAKASTSSLSCETIPADVAVQVKRCSGGPVAQYGYSGTVAECTDHVDRCHQRVGYTAEGTKVGVGGVGVGGDGGRGHEADVHTSPACPPSDDRPQGYEGGHLCRGEVPPECPCDLVPGLDDRQLGGECRDDLHLYTVPRRGCRDDGRVDG